MKNKARTKLPGQVKSLGLVSFFNDMASEMIVPLMPMFVTSVLGLGPHILGIMEGTAETTASVFKFVSGWWSDRLRKRKGLAVIGYALSCVLRPLMGLATVAWHVVTLRAADRVGKGVRTSPRDALLAAAVGPGMRGRAFGFHRAMDHAGAVAGPLIALIMLSGLAFDLRTVFLLSAIPSAATVAILLFAVREQAEPKPPAVIVAGAAADPPAEAGRRERRDFRVFLAAMVLFTLGNSTDVFLVLHAHELGVPTALAPVLWIVLHLSKTAFATPGGSFSDRFGRKASILIGWGVYGLAYLGFALADRAWQIWPLLVFYGLFYGLTEGPEKAFTADLVPPRRRGAGFGLYHMSIGVASLPASVAAGYLWKIYGAPAALGAGAVCAAAAALVLAFGLPDRKSRVGSV